MILPRYFATGEFRACVCMKVLLVTFAPANDEFTNCTQCDEIDSFTVRFSYTVLVHEQSTGREKKNTPHTHTKPYNPYSTSPFGFVQPAPKPGKLKKRMHLKRAKRQARNRETRKSTVKGMDTISNGKSENRLNPHSSKSTHRRNKAYIACFPPDKDQIRKMRGENPPNTEKIVPLSLSSRQLGMIRKRILSIKSMIGYTEA